MDDASLQHMLAAIDAMSTADEDGVWPEHVAIVNAFLSVSTQWRVVAVGGGFAPSRLMFIGLDYAAVRVALDAEGTGITPDLWRGLQIMEQEAVLALNEE